MKLYRGGSRNGKFFTFSYAIAKRYGKKVWTFETPKKLRLFKITHHSLTHTVFPNVSAKTRALLSAAFGTDMKLKNQVKLFTGKTPKGIESVIRGQRLSVVDIDYAAHEALYREFLSKRGYDGTVSDSKKASMHGGIFHGEVYIHAPRLIFSIQNEFVEYTKRTRRLIKPHHDFIQFLSGGMAIKLYLEARGIRTVDTPDFDFKFAVPKPLMTQKEVDEKSQKMFDIMYKHMKGFGKPFTWRELKGVPLDSPGKKEGKLVYKVFTFSVQGQDLVDTSLVVYPGITRAHLSRRWTMYFKMPIEKLYYMWNDTLALLAGSFTKKSIMLRNPINGNKKEKGIKNAIRVGHLSFLTSKQGKIVRLARQLVLDIAMRNKKRATESSKSILNILK